MKSMVSIVDENDKVIFEGKLTSLPLREECIINKSIELFSDSDPCIIHRTFVMKKIYLELDEYFNNALKQGKMELLKEQLPEYVVNVLDVRENPFKVILSSTVT